MPLHVHVTDSSNQAHAEVFQHEDPHATRGLVVSTEPLRKYNSQGKVFLSDVYGVDMNIAVAAGVNPDVIYKENAGSPGEWTTSSIIGGGFVFNSTGGGGVSPQEGTLCIDARTSTHLDTMQLTRSTELSLGQYDAIIGYINFTQWNDAGTSKGVEIYGWNTSTGTQVGNIVEINNYVNPGNLLTWQKFIIPLDDMALSGQTIDAIRIRTDDIGGGLPPDYFLDNIELEEIGSLSPGRFTISPDKGTWYFVDVIRFLIAADISGTVTDGTMPGLSYDTILGETPSVGIIYQRVQFGEVITSSVVKNMADFLATPETNFQTMSDGTKTLVTIDLPFKKPVILKSEDQDELRITIADDLSGLTMLRAFVGGWYEDRETKANL